MAELSNFSFAFMKQERPSHVLNNMRGFRTLVLTIAALAAGSSTAWAFRLPDGIPVTEHQRELRYADNQTQPYAMSYTDEAARNLARLAGRTHRLIAALKGGEIDAAVIALPYDVGGLETAPVGLPSGAATSGAPLTGLVDLNTADETTLESLPEVGPVTAQAILTWRTEHGGFSAVSQLLDVEGIGDATLAKLTPYVTL